MTKSEDPISVRERDYGSVTVWHTDSRSWVGIALTGEYDTTGTTGHGDETNYTCKHRLGKWFRQVLPVGPQIDLLREEIRRYSKGHVCEPGQIFD